MLIIALIIIIAAMSAIVISAKNFSANRNPSGMTQTINDGTGFVDHILAAPVHFIEDTSNELGNLMDTYKQNESLKTQLAQSKDDANKLNGLESENKELKKALNLQETLTDYQTVSANVITRDPNSWNDTLVIDSGSQEGLKNGMAVMANGGVIGRVSQVNKTTSKIALLSSSKGITNKIPVRLGDANSTSYGLLTGYDSQQNAYIITQLTTQDKFAKGSQVFTSGLGGETPRDLLIGTVLGEKDDQEGLGRQIYVKPSSNLYDIRFVFVVQRMIGGN
jgi:rod shape-determining protein MreC